MQTFEAAHGAVDEKPRGAPPPPTPAPLSSPPKPPTAPPPALLPQRPAPPPRLPRRRSPLGRLVGSAALIAVGVLAMIDLAGAAIPGPAYLALPIAMVGAGLVIGAWFGHARMLIVIGAVLTVALAIAAAGERVGDGGRTVTWQPTSIEQLASSYSIGVGNAVLDLTALDFTGRTETIDVQVSVGNLAIVLPGTVDVQITTEVDVGNSAVFGDTRSGIGQGEHTVTDHGIDGPGGGNLTINATVDIGDLEVRR